MSGAIHVVAARRINADRAGMTATATNAYDESQMPAPATALEALHGAVSTAGGALSEMLSGGIHPESPVAVPVQSGLTRATDSVAGRLGGLRPRLEGALAPGPAGYAATARERVTHILDRLKA